MTTTTGLQSIVYPVRDLEAAKAVYAALLGQPHTDSPTTSASTWTARRSASTRTATSRG